MSAAEDLSRVGAMARVLVAAQQRVEAIDKELKSAQADLLRIEQEDFPALMQEVGLKEVKLDDGTSIKVVEDITCGISAERKHAAHAWLRENGFGGLIKTALTLAFARGEEEAMNAAELLIEEGVGRAPERVEGVHFQTLKSFIKEQREKGAALPDDLFAVRPFDKAKVTPPKYA